MSRVGLNLKNEFLLFHLTVMQQDYLKLQDIHSLRAITIDENNERKQDGIINVEQYGSMGKRTCPISGIMNFSLVDKCNHLDAIVFVFHK